MSSLIRKTRNWTIGISTLTALSLLAHNYFASDIIKTKITDVQMVKVDDKFMIATEYRPFQNYDAWYRLKFNSGTIQNEAIKLRGKEVEIKKYGWRNPIFSMYENVISIKETQE